MLAVRQRSGFCSFVKSVAKSIRPILRAYFFVRRKNAPQAARRRTIGTSSVERGSVFEVSRKKMPQN